VDKPRYVGPCYHGLRRVADSRQGGGPPDLEVDEEPTTSHHKKKLVKKYYTGPRN
jgi:hypothetical protein